MLLKDTREQIQVEAGVTGIKLWEYHGDHFLTQFPFTNSSLFVLFLCLLSRRGKALGVVKCALVGIHGTMNTWLFPITLDLSSPAVVTGPRDPNPFTGAVRFALQLLKRRDVGGIFGHDG
jgi:hypothetical protein